MCETLVLLLMDSFHPYLCRLVSCLEKQQVCNICLGWCWFTARSAPSACSQAQSCCVWIPALSLFFGLWLIRHISKSVCVCVIAFVFGLTLGKESSVPRRVCLNIKAVTSQHQSGDPSAQHAQPLQPTETLTELQLISPVTTINKALFEKR